MADTETDASSDTEDDGTDADQGDELAKWKAMARKHEKEAKATASRLQALEDAGKSELEKATGRISELEPKVSAAELRATRLEVALDMGLPKSLAVRLQGETREEMEKDAADLLKTIGNGEKKTPSFDAGAKDKSHEGTSMNDLLLRGARRS